MLPDDDFTLAACVILADNTSRYVAVRSTHELNALRELLSPFPVRVAAQTRNAQYDDKLFWTRESQDNRWQDAVHRWADMSLWYANFSRAEIAETLRKHDIEVPSVRAIADVQRAPGAAMPIEDLMPLQAPEDRIRELEQELAMLRNDRSNVAMAASIKLATARMVLSSLLNSNRLDAQEKAALQGVFDVLPKPAEGAITKADEQAKLAWRRKHWAGLT